MKIRGQHITAILLAFSLVLFASCSEQAKKTNSIVGKWQGLNGSSWSEYFSDGTVTLNSGSTTLSGKYTFLEDGRLKIELGALGMTSMTTWRVDFSGDTVTFTGDAGNKEVYRRAR